MRRRLSEQQCPLERGPTSPQRGQEMARLTLSINSRVPRSKVNMGRKEGRKVHRDNAPAPHPRRSASPCSVSRVSCPLPWANMHLCPYFPLPGAEGCLTLTEWSPCLMRLVHSVRPSLISFHTSACTHPFVSIKLYTRVPGVSNCQDECPICRE